MFPKIKKYLPWITLVSLLLAATLILVFSTNRSKNLAESPETAAAADQTIERINSMKPDDIADPELIEVLEQERGTKYISQIWLFDKDGNFTFPDNLPYSNESAEERAVRQVKQMLSALPEGMLTAEQQMLMLVSSAIQAEGEHSDVFQYRAVPLESGSGAVIGYLGLAYDVSTSVGSTPQASDILMLLGMLVSLGVYWISLAVWTYLDAREHGERAIIWLVFVLIGNLVALVAYLLVRNPKERS